MMNQGWFFSCSFKLDQYNYRLFEIVIFYFTNLRSIRNSKPLTLCNLNTWNTWLYKKNIEILKAMCKNVGKASYEALLIRIGKKNDDFCFIVNKYLPFIS